MAAVARPHRHHRDGGGDRASEREWSRCSLPMRWRVPTSARSPPERRSASLMERAGSRGRVGRAAHAPRRLRTTCGRRVRQGEQRWRRPRRRRRARALGHAGARGRARVRRRPTPARACARAAPTSSVDAMFGTGFRGALDGDAAMVVDELRDVGRPRGRGRHPVGGRRSHRRGARHRGARRSDRHVRGPQARALCSSPGAVHAGEVTVVDIGIDLGPDGAEPVPLGCFDGFDVAPVPAAARRRARTSGRSAVMVVGGSAGMTGAPMFTSHAAMRAGAGMVWCSIPGAVPERDAGSVPERGNEVSSSSCARRRGPRRSTGSGRSPVGPGLGGGDHGAASSVRDCSRDAACPLVLDADGLNALAGDLAPLGRARPSAAHRAHAARRRVRARIAGEPVGDDRIAAARALAARSAARWCC